MKLDINDADIKKITDALEQWQEIALQAVSTIERLAVAVEESNRLQRRPSASRA